jgi:gamma-glutamyltranspeptidase/glutathione hydrolase
VTTIDGRETAPAAMTPTSFWENAAGTAAVQRRALQRLSVGVPGTVATWAKRSRSTGRCRSRAYCSRHPRRQPRLRRRPDILRPDTAERRLLRRRPGDRGAVPRSRRHAARRRQRLHQPGACGDVQRIAHLGRRLLPRRGGGRDRQHRAASGHLAHRQPHVAARRDDDARPAHVRRPERAPTHVNYRGLDVYSMGPPSSGGSTVGEALNILEGTRSRR